VGDSLTAIVLPPEREVDGLAGSVSGLCFAHHEAEYAAVGKIHRNQVENDAQRKGMGLAEVEKWLAPNLAYKSKR
jgi:5-methyltetrahydrofolate--homocysteine methyltransferase